LVRHRILPSKQNELEMEPTHYTKLNTKLTFSLCDFNQWKVPLELKLKAMCRGTSFEFLD
jgi:hypothetical protein